MLNVLELFWIHFGSIVGHSIHLFKVVENVLIVFVLSIWNWTERIWMCVLLRFLPNGHDNRSTLYSIYHNICCKCVCVSCMRWVINSISVTVMFYGTTLMICFVYCWVFKFYVLLSDVLLSLYLIARFKKQICYSKWWWHNAWLIVIKSLNMQSWPRFRCERDRGDVLLILIVKRCHPVGRETRKSFIMNGDCEKYNVRVCQIIIYPIRHMRHSHRWSAMIAHRHGTMFTSTPLHSMLRWSTRSSDNACMLA